MNDVVGIAVVFIIISVLAFALLKQIKYTKSLDGMVANILFLKQLKRKSKIMTVALLAFLLFFTMNLLTGLNIISSIYISNNFTALGTFVSFLYTYMQNLQWHLKIQFNLKVYITKTMNMDELKKQITFPNKS